MVSFPLERYGYDLTHLAQQENISPLREYEEQVVRVFQILLRREKTNNKYNPLLLDLDGMNRWQVVMEIVRQIAIGEAPEPFPVQQIIALNYEALFADLPDSSVNYPSAASQHPLPTEREREAALASDSEEMLEQVFLKSFPKGLWPDLEEWNASDEVLFRLRTLFLAVHQAKGQVLLFVNHFHWLVGGGPWRHALDASALLKPTLARRELQLIGACTPDQYRQYVERDAAISRRLQEVYLVSDHN